LRRRGVWLQAVVVTIAAIAFYYYVLGGGADSPQQVATVSSSGFASTSSLTPTSSAQTQASSVTSIAQTATGGSVTIVTDQLNLDHQESMAVADWYIAVKNSGSVPVRSLTMSLSPPFAASMCTNTSGALVGGSGTGTCTAATMASPLQPGQTISGGVTLDIASGMPMQGTMYTMTLTTSFADGSTTTDSFSIFAQMMM
jgi:hypothetical protein